ncbi:AraC family transcriptional regulator [Pseudomonas segetis]
MTYFYLFRPACMLEQQSLQRYIDMVENVLIRGSSLTAFPDLVRELGRDPAPYLAQLNVSETLISDPKQFMSYAGFVQTLERVSQDLDCPDFGLRMAQQQSVGVLGPLALIAQFSETALDGLQRIARYMAYHSPAAVVKIEDPTLCERPELFFSIALTQVTQQRQTIELSLGFAMQVMRLLSGRNFKPLSVSFQHTPLLPVSHYRVYFGCPVYFEASSNSMEIRSADLLRPIDVSDPLMCKTMEAFVANALAEVSHTLVSKVRQLIQQLLPLQRRCTLSLVARHLGMGERTLQRRLKVERVFFEELVDEVRQELAQSYLKRADMSMAQVAGLLGYREQSSFNRACRRWFGESPRGLRKD